MRADALEMYARLMIRRLRPAVFIKMLLYHFIGKFLVASRPNATGSPKSISSARRGLSRFFVVSVHLAKLDASRPQCESTR
jgi:hypothetical protein